jgi:hypothetical protein
MSDDVRLARMDSEHSFKQFTETGRVIAPMSTGVYAGTESGIYYGEGGIIPKMEFIKVAECGAKDIPIQYIETTSVRGVNIEGRFPLIHTDEGLCLGMPQGQLLNLTEERYVMPAGTTGASMMREINGQIHLITSFR